MGHYKINSNQILLLSGHLNRFIKARAESYGHIRELMEGLRHEMESDPAEAICNILKEVCANPPQGEEENRRAQRAASIPALYGAWVSARPKHLLVIYMHKEGFTAALTRSRFWGSRTEFIPLKRYRKGSRSGAEGVSDKDFSLEYDRSADLLTLNGKTLFWRVGHNGEQESHNVTDTNKENGNGKKLL